MPEVYTPPFKPRAHQKAALDKMEGRESFALFMAMRTGKTKVTLDDYGRMELDGRAKNLLVIAPGGVYRGWEEACQDHLSADLKSRAIVHTWESGAGAGGQRRLSAFMAEQVRPRILLMNVEALSSVKLARETALSFAASGRCVGAVDESTIIMNASSLRTKFINGKLAQHLEYRRILSGLPTPKSPLDLYGQLEFLDWRILGFRSYYAFRNRYAVMYQAQFGGRSVQLVKGYRDLDDLQSKLAPHSHRVLLEDCYDLPPKIYMTREVELTDEQKRLYREMRDFATAQLSATDHVTATVVIAQILKLHRILCGQAVDEGGALHQIAEKRTEAVVDLLKEQGQGKAIIWTAYDACVQAVAKAIKDEFGEDSCARFWGGNAGSREDEERRFKTDPACRFMVATAAAGGRGREWSVADLVIYHASTNNLEHRAQSEERPQRVGREDQVAYVDLIARGTVDEKIVQALRQKIDLSATIMGDAYRDWLI